MIGVIDIMAAALIGVVSSSPFKKKSILITTPKKAAKIKVIKSFSAIFSLGKNAVTSQNNAVAPATLRNTRAVEDTNPSLIIFLAKVKLIP